jgi:uncharacterized membrane protein YphA (DoxX/SURF4 family)
MENRAAAAMGADVSQNQQPASSGQELTTPRQWTLFALVAFRAAFSYFVLYSFPYPFDLIPWLGGAFGWDRLFSKMTLWTGAHIFHFQQPLSVRQGDSLYVWTLNFVVIALSALVVCLWSVLDRQRQDYRYLRQWLWLYVRVCLGLILIGYGAIKVVKVQFSDLALWRLMETYGESSSMGLLWSFMGYSKTYNLFTGLVEFTAGALLFIPRVASLGALLSIGAMMNVLVLNLSYDVPVKLYSFNYLLMGLFLISKESRRLLNVFVLNRSAEPSMDVPFFRRRWLNQCLLGGQVLLLFYFGCSELYSDHREYKEMGDGSPVIPVLYGVYSVDEYIEDGVVRPALFTDPTRWHRITFDRHTPLNCFFDGQIPAPLKAGTCVALFPVEGPMQRFNGDLDESKKTLELTKLGNENWKAHLSFERPSPRIVVLTGVVEGKNIRAKLRSLDANGFLINQRGFHWINEVPFNR